MHRQAATGFPLVFSTCTAHSASSTCSKYCNDRNNTVTTECLFHMFQIEVVLTRHAKEKKEKKTWTDLSNHEIHILLYEHIQLFLEDSLHLCLTLATQVGRSLTHSTSYQCISFISYFSCQVTGCLVDLYSLEELCRQHETVECALCNIHVCLHWLCEIHK